MTGRLYIQVGRSILESFIVNEIVFIILTGMSVANAFLQQVFSTCIKHIQLRLILAAIILSLYQ